MEQIGKLIKEYIDNNLDSVRAIYEKNIQYGVNINIDETNWIDMIFDTKNPKTIETRSARVYNQWKKLSVTQPYIGIVLTRSNPTKKLPTGILVGCAKLLDVKLYETPQDFQNDISKHKVELDSKYMMQDDYRRCGLVLGEVEKFNRPIKLENGGQGTIRKISIKTC